MKKMANIFGVTVFVVMYRGVTIANQECSFRDPVVHFFEDI